MGCHETKVIEIKNGNKKIETTQNPNYKKNLGTMNNK